MSGLIPSFGAGDGVDDLWTGAELGARDVQTAYARTNEQERDLAAARRRAASALTSVVSGGASRPRGPRPPPGEGASARADPGRGPSPRSAPRRLARAPASPHASSAPPPARPSAEQADAATTIQKHWRGARDARLVSTALSAARKIQRFWRRAKTARDARARRRAARLAKEAQDARAAEIDSIAAAVRASRSRRGAGTPEWTTNAEQPSSRDATRRRLFDDDDDDDDAAASDEPSSSRRRPLAMPPTAAGAGDLDPSSPVAAPATPSAAPRSPSPLARRSPPTLRPSPPREPRAHHHQTGSIDPRPDSAYAFATAVPEDDLPEWATPSKVPAEERTREMFAEIDAVLAGSKETRARLAASLERKREQRSRLKRRASPSPSPSPSPSLSPSTGPPRVTPSGGGDGPAAASDFDERRKNFSAAFASLAMSAEGSSADMRSLRSSDDPGGDPAEAAMARYAAALAAMTTASSDARDQRREDATSATTRAGAPAASSPAAAAPPSIRPELLPAPRPVSARRGEPNSNVARGARSRPSEDAALEARLAAFERRDAAESARAASVTARHRRRAGVGRERGAFPSWDDDGLDDDTAFGRMPTRRVGSGPPREARTPKPVVFRPAKRSVPDVLPLYKAPECR